MDCGSVYIKMCEKAEEIQQLIIPLKIIAPEYQSQYGADMSKSGNWFHLNIWLPRQDQLQAMVLDLYTQYDNLVQNMVSDCHAFSTNWQTYQRWDSFEQLWLAFVMKKRLGKVWSGTEWTQYRIDTVKQLNK